jgi:hypothetical protein
MRDLIGRRRNSGAAPRMFCSGYAACLWNRVALSLIQDRRCRQDWDHDDQRAYRNTLTENARLLALDVAMADAAIACWDDYRDSRAHRRWQSVHDT